MKKLLLALGILASAVCACRAEETAEEIFKRADDLFNKGNYADALTEYEKGTRLDHTYATAYNNMGVIYSSDETKIIQSVGFLIQAVKIDPRYPEPYANLGIVFYRTGQNDKAEEYVRRAIQLSPDEPRYYFTLAWIIATGAKKYDEAINLLNRALFLDPESADAFYVLGLIYVDKNDKTNVFDQITNLRKLNREDLASELENLVRSPYREMPLLQQPAAQKRTGYEAADKGAQIVYDIKNTSGTASAAASKGMGKGNMRGSGTIQMTIKFKPVEVPREAELKKQ